MKGSAIAYDPCYKCTNKIMCEVCELKLHRDGVTIQKWIPVKERPPEKEGWYQVYTTPDKGTRSINKAQYKKQPSRSVNAGEGYWCGSGGIWSNVTHWMPLPDAPKGE